MHDALLRRIETKTDELVELTRELIRIPTVNPPGEAYAECAKRLGEWLQRRGFEMSTWRSSIWYSQPG